MLAAHTITFFLHLLKIVKTAIQSRKPYLQQLVQTQRMRGVTSGVVFSSLLGEPNEPMETVGLSRRQQARNAAGTRTLSMLESRQIKHMEPDIDSFVKKVCEHSFAARCMFHARIINN